jgi:putative phosphonate catabolism associated alcohol dehydrogenase
MRTSATAAHPAAVTPNPAPMAMVWEGPGMPHRELAVPGVVLAPGEALVQLDFATVCGSDLHTIAGDRAAEVPLVLGHEQVGRVVAVGEGARLADGTALRRGDRVIWSVAVSCGVCDRCKRGIPQKCRRLAKYGHTRMHRGWELNGGFATHVHLRAGTAIVAAPAALPDAVAAPAACSTATAVAALEAAAQTMPLGGVVVLVTGAGMVGLAVTALAADQGATVVVSDPDPVRRARALRFGASAVADPSARAGSPDALAAVLTDAAGAREPLVAIEASGAPAAVRTALESVGVGGVVVLVGTVSPVGPVPVDPEAVVRGLLTVRGVHNYAPAQLQAAVDALGRLAVRHPFAELVGAVYPLTQLDAALAHAARADEVRVGLNPRA